MYEDKIAIEGTTTASAKATFLGIKWSSLESKDIIVGSNGDVDVIETEKPGTSIREISSCLVNSRFFPGDVLKKDDIRVEGTTINGESVTLEVPLNRRCSRQWGSTKTAGAFLWKTLL